jgi:hypothetical protein
MPCAEAISVEAASSGFLLTAPLKQSYLKRVRCNPYTLVI